MNAGQTVNLAEFQGKKLKLIPRTNKLPPTDLSSNTTTEKLSTSHNSKLLNRKIF